MTDDFEKRAREAANEATASEMSGELIPKWHVADFIAGAKWARAEMQAEIERLNYQLKLEREHRGYAEKECDRLKGMLKEDW